MHLIQLLLPLFDNQARAFPRAHYERVATELTTHFGGVTAYTRAPAEGRWHDEEAGTTRDEIIVYEVMTDVLDADWWRSYRERLERQFAQERLVVRAHAITLL